MKIITHRELSGGQVELEHYNDSRSPYLWNNVSRRLFHNKDEVRKTFKKNEIK